MPVVCAWPILCPLLICYLVSDTFLDIVTDVLGVDEWGINRLLIS